jgi:hypothetical protein
MKAVASSYPVLFLSLESLMTRLVAYSGEIDH